MCIGPCEETIDIIIPVASRCAEYVHVAKDMCCDSSRATTSFHLSTLDTASLSSTAIDTTFSRYGK